MPETLLGIALLREFVESVFLTGRVMECEPQSALLIAQPESGKTSVVLEKNVASAVALSDVTGRGLQELCKMKPEISHLIINDMVAVMSHRQTVNRYTLSMINAMTEEGIQATAFPGQLETYGNGRRGLIACLTSDLVSDGRAWWNKIGLTSRVIPFSYYHSTELTLKIKAAIDSGKNEKRKEAPPPREALFIPKERVVVKLASREARKIRLLADEKSKEIQETGYRRLKQFRSLARGHAIWRRQRAPYAVAEDDVRFLERIFPYMSYTEARPL